jgi:hypothetical protein
MTAMPGVLVIRQMRPKVFLHDTPNGILPGTPEVTEVCGSKEGSEGHPD